MGVKEVKNLDNIRKTNTGVWKAFTEIKAFSKKAAWERKKITGFHQLEMTGCNSVFRPFHCLGIVVSPQRIFLLPGLASKNPKRNMCLWILSLFNYSSGENLLLDYRK